ncbi:MAG: GGDEF domain-containing protein [Giesbergeria sp.]|jgi:diguanylate cyclase (GGDEF)-like protein|nr:GGDEF domain-containing protein [Giesbergeria sp.]
MRWSIGFRLGVLLACFSAMAALLVGYFTFVTGRDMLNDRAQRSLLGTTQILAQHMQTGFSSVARDTAMLAALAAATQATNPQGVAAVQAHDRDMLANVFKATLTARPSYQQIRLISAQDHGLELVRVERSGMGLARVEGDALQEKAHFPFVFETLQLGSGAVYVSEFGINHEGNTDPGGDQPVFNMAASVVRDGQVAGIIVIRVATDAFFGNFSAGLPSPYGFYLLNRWGDFLVHSDRSQTYGFDRGQRILAQDSMPPVGEIIQGRTRQVVMAHQGRDGTPQALAFVRMPLGFQDDGRFMVVGLSQPLAVVQGEAVELGRSIAKVLLALCLGGIVLAAWVSRVVTGPLHAMVRATQAFSQGRAHGELPVKRQDELGELARSFQDMELRISLQMSELNASRDAMTHLAHHDALTGLPNRRMFEQRLAQALEMSRRTGRPCAVLFVDLDGFKAINDNLGHAMGDAVLQATARAILGAVRQMDTVARLAGDEFTVLCENVESEEAALQIAAKLQQAFDLPLEIHGKLYPVRASVGLSLFPRDAQDAHTLLASADAAMYRAKLNRRNGTM